MKTMKGDISHRLLFLRILIIALIFQACEEVAQEPDTPAVTQTPFYLPDLPQFPKVLNIPEDNPMTEEGIRLGRYLFYDGRLSGRSHVDSLMSCATCHIQSRGFEVGIDHPKFTGGQPFGLPTPEFPGGKKTPHMTMPLVNLAYISSGYLWNGMIHETNEKSGLDGYEFMGDTKLNYKHLESLVWMGILAEHEMNGSIDKTVNMISSIKMYETMFKSAFGSEEVTIDRISKAIAQFIRSITAYRFKFYKYVQGEVELTPSELRGQNLFFSEEADCFHCHAGSLLMTTTQFYNNAKDAEFNDPRDRYAFTSDPFDKGAYRAPSLINCELNGPYMHDGRFKTLDEVIDFYSEGLVYSDYVHPLMKAVREHGVQLTEQKKSDLIAFLLTLTDRELLTDPFYSCPETLGKYGVSSQK